MLDTHTKEQGKRPSLSENQVSFVGSVLTTGLPVSTVETIVTIATIILQLMVVVLLIVVMTVDIFLDTWADAENNIHVVYITFLTALSTLVTTTTIGQIRKHWSKRSIHELEPSPSRPYIDQSPLVSRLLNLTGLGDLTDWLRGWQVSLSFALTGLITTAVVAGLTPRPISCKSRFKHNLERMMRSKHM